MAKHLKVARVNLSVMLIFEFFIKKAFKIYHNYSIFGLINMFKRYFLLILLALSMSSNAAYYFDLNGHGKMTVSKDQKTAVILRVGNKPLRLVIKKALADQIDNYGRPYNLSIYFPEDCRNSNNYCNGPAVAVKLYIDKESGFVIWATLGNDNKVVWSENLTIDKLTED